MEISSNIASHQSAHFRTSKGEQERIRSLFELIPQKGGNAIDIGARDGYLSIRLAERFLEVTALDLETPKISHPQVKCVEGNICSLDFPPHKFELALCAEVLEHIPPSSLHLACKELGRICGKYLVIGVPFNQDLRCGRTTCQTCGALNPPYGHLNSFDENKLRQLFPEFEVSQTHFVGQNRNRTNSLATLLNDLSGNPYGTYDQEEGCVQCGGTILGPMQRSFSSRALAFTAHKINQAQKIWLAPTPAWIHLLLIRKGV